MKTNKTISLDTDVVAELKTRQINVSETINSLLRQYLDLGEAKSKEDRNLLKEKYEAIQAKAFAAKTQWEQAEQKEKDKWKGKVIIR